MASSPVFVTVANTLSVSPGMILRLKELCETYSIDECRELVNRAMLMESAVEVRMLLRNDWNDRLHLGY